MNLMLFVADVFAGWLDFFVFYVVDDVYVFCKPNKGWKSKNKKNLRSGFTMVCRLQFYVYIFSPTQKMVGKDRKNKTSRIGHTLFVAGFNNLHFVQNPNKGWKNRTPPPSC